MAKKTNDNTIDFIYANNKENSNKKKNIKKKQNNNVPKKTLPKNDIINLDNEIIIGLTPKPVQKQVKKETEKKNLNKKQSQKQVKPRKPINNKSKVPKKNTVKIKVVKWTSILILVIGIIILFMLSPIFDIKQINVEGIEKLSTEEVVAISQIQLNENMFKVKIAEVIEEIENNTYVENANVSRELPSTIKIIVKERTPQYRIEIANGNAYIDSKGYILEISSEILQVPTITGYGTSMENIIDFQNTKKLLDEDCTKIEVINQIIEAAKNNSVLTYITSIDISDINNITLNLDSEKKVAYLGDGSNANLRILYLKTIIEEEAGKEGEAFIDGDLHTLKPKPKPYFREKI